MGCPSWAGREASWLGHARRRRSARTRAGGARRGGRRWRGTWRGRCLLVGCCCVCGEGDGGDGSRAAGSWLAGASWSSGDPAHRVSPSTPLAWEPLSPVPAARTATGQATLLADLNDVRKTQGAGFQETKAGVGVQQGWYAIQMRDEREYKEGRARGKNEGADLDGRTSSRKSKVSVGTCRGGERAERRGRRGGERGGIRAESSTPFSSRPQTIQSAPDLDRSLPSSRRKGRRGAARERR